MVSFVILFETASNTRVPPGYKLLESILCVFLTPSSTIHNTGHIVDSQEILCLFQMSFLIPSSLCFYVLSEVYMINVVFF